MTRWWEWRIVQWWWYRRYKRADRRAFIRECSSIADQSGRKNSRSAA